MEQEDKKKKSFLDKLIQRCSNPLFLLILITLGMFIYLLSVQARIGVPYWDVFNYLNNALYLAGMGNEGVTGFIYLPPLVPFLTSLLFRMGYVSINAIFIVSGLLFVIGVVGFYLLLKERFSPIESFTGSLIFISLPVMISWATSGAIDIPGVTFSILTLYFLVSGVKKNSKFLYLVIPFFILAFLTRYTAGLIIIPIFIYLLLNIDLIKKINNLKKVIILVSAELITLFMLFVYFLVKLGIFSSIFTLLMGVATSSSTGVGDVAYNPNIFYYLQNLLNYISISSFTGSYQQLLNPSQASPSILAYLIAMVTLIGLILYVNRILISKSESPSESPRNSKSNITKLLKTILILVLTTICIVSFYYKSFILSEITLLFTLCIFYYLVASSVRDKYKLSLDLMFIGWFGAYLIFQSILPFKVDRYSITMIPALIYFIILGFSELMHKFGQKIKNPNLKSWGVYLIIALIFLSSATTTYIGHTPKKTFTVDIGNSCKWIEENDPSYQDKIICSDYPNAVTWYLNKSVLGGYPRFFNGSDEFNNYLQANGVDYYIDSTSKTHLDLKGYRIIQSFGVVVIYKKIKT